MIGASLTESVGARRSTDERRPGADPSALQVPSPGTRWASFRIASMPGSHSAGGALEIAGCAGGGAAEGWRVAQPGIRARSGSVGRTRFTDRVRAGSGFRVAALRDRGQTPETAGPCRGACAPRPPVVHRRAFPRRPAGVRGTLASGGWRTPSIGPARRGRSGKGAGRVVGPATSDRDVRSGFSRATRFSAGRGGRGNRPEKWYVLLPAAGRAAGPACPSGRRGTLVGCRVRGHAGPRRPGAPRGTGLDRAVTVC